MAKATRRKAARRSLFDHLFDPSFSSSTDSSACIPPSRHHAIHYHRPQLLHGSLSSSTRSALLSWFDATSTARGMPWRKAYLSPPRDTPSLPTTDATRAALSTRAYQVWISEIMLQQTRVAVVVDYWNRWMARWPTIQDLAAAEPDHVLAQWRGLGYYSRATRIHEAAKLVVDDEELRGLLPQDVATLQERVPGVGRYTAGAISAIVFGRAAPMVDGNVLRVLSRQLGIFGDVKGDKAVIDVLWAAADALVQAVADGDETSDRPGRWGQALMELGSTVCTPKPSCEKCPITATCRAYAEGHAVAHKEQPKVVDIEDSCTLCATFEELGKSEDPAPEKKKTKGQTTLAAFAFTGKSAGKRKREEVDMNVVTNHARKFPLKIAKKAVREEETIVCAIRREDGQYLIRRRPEKGLLAGLWEFPCKDLADDGGTEEERDELALSFVEETLGKTGVEHVGELGSVPWVFSHLKLTMHVHIFTLSGTSTVVKTKDKAPTRWSGDVDSESIGTGMRKCWELVRAAEDT